MTGFTITVARDVVVGRITHNAGDAAALTEQFPHSIRESDTTRLVCGEAWRLGDAAEILPSFDAPGVTAATLTALAKAEATALLLHRVREIAADLTAPQPGYRLALDAVEVSYTFFGGTCQAACVIPFTQCAALAY